MRSKIGIVFSREYMVRVKKKSFIIMTLLTPILFAALMIVPGLIALYSGDEKAVIKVSDESGIVLPYMKSDDKIEFAPMTEEEMKLFKEDFSKIEATAVVKVSPLDTNSNLSLSIYSVKQLNIEIQSKLESMASDAVEDYKIKSYNIEGLDRIIAELTPDIGVKTYLIDDTGEEKASHVEVSMIIGYISSFLIYMFIFMFGNMVMRSVIEEKTTRIVEVIVSSVKPFQLMMGKILGVAAVGLTQFLIWVIFTLLLVTGFTSAFGLNKVEELAKSSSEPQIATMEQVMENGGLHCSAESDTLVVPDAEDVGAKEIAGEIMEALGGVNFTQIIVCFIIYFMLGYLLYSGLFAAVGSAVENEADTQQLILPVTIPLIIGLFIMLHTFQYPESSLSFWGSIIPFTSPMVMMARIAYGVPFWELALSIALLAATFLLLTYISAKIYRVGILMYGKKASLKDLVKWFRAGN